ncbi:type II CAAX prenyl endopeptidase Rce1 family protein [Alkalilimnicola ehrlichii]
MGVIQTAVIGVVFARLVLRWGSLWPVIIAHALLNSFSLIMFRVLAGLE